MKKVSFLLGVLFVASLALTSCKKDWNCECTFADYPEFNTTTVIPDSKKKDAQEACDALDTAAKLVDGKCELKKK